MAGEVAAALKVAPSTLLVAEIVLHRPQIGALVGQVVAIGMAQYVRSDPAELRLRTSQPDDIVDGLAGGLRLALRGEQPGQVVVAGGEVALDRAQLVAGDRMLDG
jgi:malonyl CoA-acyl carrier protein transacylase